MTQLVGIFHRKTRQKCIDRPTGKALTRTEHIIDGYDDKILCTNIFIQYSENNVSEGLFRSKYYRQSTFNWEVNLQ